MSTPPFDRVVIVGLGLIGGSLAHVLAPHMRVVGVDADAATCKAARRDGIEVVADVRDAAGSGALVVVAVPVPYVAEVFAHLAGCEVQLVTDVASVKQPVVDAARQASLRFVGGHPMAGRELSGYGAASDSLFSGARWALCLDAGARVRDALDIAAVVLATGASVVPTVAAEHDRTVAIVSHLPHVLAAVLASAAGDASTRDLAFGLAAGSFRDGTRVARSPADFWAGISVENAANLAGIVRDSGAAFLQLADALEADDRAGVAAFFARGVQGRIEFERRTALPTTLTIDNADIERDDGSVRDTLLALGRRGGYVTHIEQSADAMMLRARVPEAAVGQ
ncbi:MAG TPA: prephenate dehydrogenase/arogenate dehydrogenase family protein [Acidimicrobiia bacterium]